MFDGSMIRRTHLKSANAGDARGGANFRGRHRFEKAAFRSLERRLSASPPPHSAFEVPRIQRLVRA